MRGPQRVEIECKTSGPSAYDWFRDKDVDTAVGVGDLIVAPIPPFDLRSNISSDHTC